MVCRAARPRVRSDAQNSLARAALRHRIAGKGAKAGRYHLTNTESDWSWLVNFAGKAARWLGHIRFERITDNRNAEPIVHRKARVAPEAWVFVGLDVDIPDLADIEPRPGATGFVPRQAYQFAIFGEKGSLEEVLLPLAIEYEADLYLPSGEISNSLLYRMAKDAAEDGRPLVVFTVSDCDPAGWQMPVSIGRKLQALRDLLFPDLQFEVVPVALTVEQVRELGLPSTPLKETEKRADRWRAAFGIEQTEIDALATLRPDVLREIVDRAFDPYFDQTLRERVSDARTNGSPPQNRRCPSRSTMPSFPISATRRRAGWTNCGRRSTASITSFDWRPRATSPCPRSKCPSPRSMTSLQGKPWCRSTRTGWKRPGR